MGVWQQLDKEELEKQYSPSCWSHRMDKDAVIEAHVKWVTEGTKVARSITQVMLGVPYGAGDGDKLDVYLPSHPPAALPLLVYLHGGYWQFFSKEESGFMAPPLVKKGIAVVAVDHDIAPKGNMDSIVSQVRRSVAFVVQQYSHISGIYLCGHSAGAHLVAMALATDWKEYGVTPDIKGAFLVSGIYDLLPIVRTSVNDPLKMNDEIAVRNSPMQLIPEVKRACESCEIVIALGEHDSPEFRRQSREYYQALQSAGLKVHFEDILNTDHFNVIEQLSDEGYRLTQMILKMILEG
ncbi:kynurenine formamidase [Latimeria chalumnae]|uniref:Kynurenine formamidase n=2 Tax=Latimeria chalumnae TaxID=7897 RepID=H3BDX0_LATCH|nr:PREDICTED: kynurenine formamidase [Latimeria chalumnae]|eukprot:XP_005989153.1 PREDICTED: kynurenine formamidase [Latimeria chalumnae]